MPRPEATTIENRAAVRPLEGRPFAAGPLGRGVGRAVAATAGALLIFLVRLYRWTLSPAKTFLFGPLAHCRFEPSCSQYALDALRTHGPLRGSWLAVRRVCRCHPWGDCGCDPVPPRVNRRGDLQPSKSPPPPFGAAASRTH